MDDGGGPVDLTDEDRAALRELADTGKQPGSGEILRHLRDAELITIENKKSSGGWGGGSGWSIGSMSFGGTREITITEAGQQVLANDPAFQGPLHAPPGEPEEPPLEGD